MLPKFNPLHDTGDEEYGEQDDDPQDAPLMALEKEAEQETAAFEVDDNTVEKEDDVIEADHVAAALGDIDDLLIEEAAQAVDEEDAMLMDYRVFSRNNRVDISDFFVNFL